MPSPIRLLSHSEFAVLSRRLSERRGVGLGPAMNELASMRLWPRVSALGLSGFAGYVRYLESAARGDEELDLAWSLIAGERRELLADAGELDEIARLVLAPMIATRRYARRLRVWVPACGTGADVYSVGLVTLGLLGAEASSWSVSIVGTDVSEASVSLARRGVFAAAETRRLSALVRNAWFASEDGMLRARGWLRERVRFEALDARDRVAARRLDDCDVVVMRGTLGVMEPAAREAVLASAWERLTADGVVVVSRQEAAIVARAGFTTECGVLVAAARGVRSLAMAA